MSVRDKHQEYNDMHSRWQMCRDASEGEHAVHSKGETYLPRLKDEEDDAYKLRLKMTPFFNATWRTLAGLRGMIFRKPPLTELPKVVVEASKNIDRSGTKLQGLVREVVEESLTVGRVGLLVDYPLTQPGTTLADSQRLGLRAFITLYEAEHIYNWKYQVDNGSRVLVQVRLTECVTVDDPLDEFKSKEETRYRVLDLDKGAYRQRVYRLNERGEEVMVGEPVYPQMQGKSISFIPFVGISVDELGMDVDAPPLIDLVTTNFHHYMQATSYERGCFFSGLPTLFITGMETTDSEISIGGQFANCLGSPNARAEMVEVNSKFEALRTNLEDKKREMAVLGARMLEGQKVQTEAADTLARRQSGEESILSTMAQTVSEGVEQALTWLALWEGSTEPVSYQLNRDLMPASMTAPEITALMGAWQSGGISKETLFDNFKAGEIIADDADFETEEEKIANGQLQFTQLQAALAGMMNPGV